MKALYTEVEYSKARGKDKLACECYDCGGKFFLTKRGVNRVIAFLDKKGSHYDRGMYCSSKCQHNHRKTSIDVKCKQCDKEFKKLPSQIKKTKSHFCNRSCAAKYNNKIRPKRVKVEKPKKLKEIKYCILCNETLSGRRSKFCSRKCKNKVGNHNHQVYQNQRKRGLTRKIKLAEMLGGKCNKCGYKDNYAALHFHHKKQDKSFLLTMRKLSNSKWNACVDEVKKCQLLCANCHAETHWPQLNYELITQEKN